MPFVRGTRYTTLARGAAVRPFDPSQIAQLLLDFDAEKWCYSDAGTTLCVANDPVYRWYDATRTIYVENTTPANQPLWKVGANGQPYLQFDGSSDHLLGTISQSFFEHLVVVSADIKSTANDLLYAIRQTAVGPDPLSYLFGDTGVMRARYRSGNTTLFTTASGPAVSAGTWANWGLRLAGGALDAMKNNSVASTISTSGGNAGSMTTLCIGGSFYDAIYAQANISRFLLFAPEPSSGDQASLQTYLAARFPT